MTTHTYQDRRRDRQPARRALLVRDGLAAVTEWEAEFGPLSEGEMDAARRRVAGEARLSAPRQSA